MRVGIVYAKGIEAGRLEERSDGYHFLYNPNYLADSTTEPISLLMPKTEAAHYCPVLFPFFAGMLTEGEPAKVQCRILHLDEKDYFGRLLACAGEDTIGAVTVKPLMEGVQ